MWCGRQALARLCAVLVWGVCFLFSFTQYIPRNTIKSNRINRRRRVPRVLLACLSRDGSFLPRVTAMPALLGGGAFFPPYWQVKLTL